MQRQQRTYNNFGIIYAGKYCWIGLPDDAEIVDVETTETGVLEIRYYSNNEYTEEPNADHGFEVSVYGSNVKVVDKGAYENAIETVGKVFEKELEFAEKQYKIVIAKWKKK